MNRRTFLKLWGVCAAALGTPWPTRSSAATLPAPRKTVGWSVPLRVAADRTQRLYLPVLIK